MRRLTLQLLAVSALAALAAARQAAATPTAERAARILASPRDLHTPPLQPFSPPRPVHLEIDRGANLIIIENHELPLIDGTFLFRGGSEVDPPDLAGLSELLADSLRGGGSRNTPGTGLDDVLDAFAATVSITAEQDALRIDFNCLSEDLDGVLEAIGELLIIPAYPSEEVEKSRRRLLTRLRTQAGEPRRQADAALLRAIYGADAKAARRPTQRSVDAITRDDLLRFHQDHIGVDRLVVGVIGDVQAATVGAQIETLLTRLPRARATLEREPRVFLQPARTRIYIVDRPDALQSEVRLAAPGTRRIDRDYSALSLWSYAVGFGSASNRMMVRLRTELGLVYGGALYYQPEWNRSGRLEAYYGTRNDAVGASVSALFELLRGGLEPLPSEEFETVRARVRRAEVFEVDRPRKVLARALDLEFHGHPEEFWTRHAERLEELDPQEVAAAVKRHLDPDRLIVVAVGPADQLEPQLAPLGEVVRWSTAESEAAGVVARLFAGTGGREAWQAARFIETEVDILREGQPSQSERIWRDLEGPRVRVEGARDGTLTTLLVNEQGAWSSSEGAVVELPTHADLLAAAEHDPGRILKRLASLDASGLRASDGLRLELNPDAPDDDWLEVDDAGHITRIGYLIAGESIVVELTGWTEIDGIVAPTEVYSSLRGERRRIRSVRLHDDLPATLFERP